MVGMLSLEKDTRCFSGPDFENTEKRGTSVTEQLVVIGLTTLTVANSTGPASSPFERTECVGVSV
jgi:hypothetical protein